MLPPLVIRQSGAIASRLAAEIYGLDILFESAEDDEHNTTRFLLMSATSSVPAAGGDMITTLVFQLRSVPAALYKALGGFATNGVNLTKLESYIRVRRCRAGAILYGCSGTY